MLPTWRRWFRRGSVCGRSDAGRGSRRARPLLMPGVAAAGLLCATAAVSAAAPGAFGKAFPMDNAQSMATSLTLAWGTSAGATSYEFCIDATNDDACTLWHSVSTATSLPVSGLEYSTTRIL